MESVSLEETGNKKVNKPQYSRHFKKIKMYSLHSGDKYYQQNIDDTKKKVKNSGGKSLDEVGYTHIRRNGIPGRGHTNVKALEWVPI